MHNLILCAVLSVGFLFCSCSKSTDPNLNNPATVDSLVKSGGNLAVFVATENGKLLALDASNGAQLWSFTLNSETVRNAQLSSPAYADSILYVGSTDQNIYAVNAITGKEVWHYPTNSYPGYFYSSPVVANGVVYIPGYEQRFYALDAKTGVLKWSKDFPRDFQSSPTYFEDKIFVTSNDGVIYALDARTGNTLWSDGGDGYNWGFDYSQSSPCVKDSVVYALTNDVSQSTSLLNELSTENGTAHHGVYASFYIPSMFSFISSPAVDDSMVYFAGMNDSLYAARIGDTLFYSKHWSFGTGAAIYSSPTFDDSSVYVGSNDGFMYAVNKHTGEMRWKFVAEMGGPVTSSPVVANGVVFYGTEGFFYAVNAKDGTLKWRVADMYVSSSPVLITGKGKVYHGSISGMTN